MRRSRNTRSLDAALAVPVIVGGLNWGLVGLLDFDVVARLFGNKSPLSRAVYTLVGLGALYQIASAVQRRAAPMT